MIESGPGGNATMDPAVPQDQLAMDVLKRGGTVAFPEYGEKPPLSGGHKLRKKKFGGLQIKNMKK